MVSGSNRESGFPARESAISDQPQLHPPSSIRGDQSRGADHDSPFLNAHQHGSISVLEVCRGDEKTMDAALLGALLSLAEPCSPVVVDLSHLVALPATLETSGLSELAALAWHWPATPVVLVCNDEVRTAVQRVPWGEHLVVTTSVLEALAILTRRPHQDTVELRLAPHPTSPRAARDFVSRTLLDWRLARSIPGACLVASELATNAMVHAQTNLAVSLTDADGRLRIAVRDGSSDQPRPHGADPDRTEGRGLQIVGSLTRAWGVLATRDGGKVVWAVTDH